MKTPRQEAWEYLLALMKARFFSGDIGIEDQDRSEKVAAAGDKLIQDLRRQGPPKGHR